VAAISNSVGKLGAVGKEFAAALLLWMRGTMSAPPGTPAAVAGVTDGERTARVEDPSGRIASALLAETAVRLAFRSPKNKGLLPINEIVGREAGRAIAEEAGGTITTEAGKSPPG